jgi:DNA polymerase-4
VDEAACDWSHRGFDEDAALALRAKVLAETGLSVSIGLSRTPLVSKMATEFAKSRDDHLFVVRPGEEPDFLWPQPIRALLWVGPKTEARLLAAEIDTIGELAATPMERLTELFGSSHGQYLYDASRGIDRSELVAERVSKSVSAEHTFARDTADRAVLWAQLQDQAAEVARRMAHEGMQSQEVAIKLRYSNWETLTRQMKLSEPTVEPEVLAQGAATLMKRHWDQRRFIRLIGLRAGRLTPIGGDVQPALPA